MVFGSEMRLWSVLGGGDHFFAYLLSVKSVGIKRSAKYLVLMSLMPGKTLQ